jgi:hypothetical protein
MSPSPIQICRVEMLMHMLIVLMLTPPVAAPVESPEEELISEIVAIVGIANIIARGCESFCLL